MIIPITKSVITNRNNNIGLHKLNKNKIGKIREEELAMIGETLQVIADQLNAFFKLRFDTEEDKVSLNSVVSPDGNIDIDNYDKVLVTLVNVQQEKLTRNFKSYKSHQNNQFSGKKPAVTIHLFIAVCCLFSENNYQQALTFLSSVIEFFQNKYAFTRSNTPSLNNRIEKITFEIENFTSQEVSHLWGVIGTKYVPSIIYKVSVINYTGGDIDRVIPGTSKADTNSNPLSR